jgi:glycosyltransferase involved in cell wall biosynthesis
MQNTKLNVLIYPMLSVNNLNADSNYIIIKQLCNELLKTKKYNFFLLIDSNRKYVKDDLNSLVKILKVPMPRSKKHQVIHFNSNIFREIFKKYAFDIIWNNVVEQGHHLKYFPDTIVDAFRPKVFNYHHYVIHRSLEKITNYLPCTHILYDQIVGSLGTDLNFFHTQYCYDMLMEEANDILNEDKIKLLKEKSIITLGGYTDKIKSKNKYDKFTFIYNHRLDGYKNWQTTFNIFDQLWDEGLEFQVILTAGDKDNINTINKKPYCIVKSFTKHSDYIKELSKCHANTINSRHETYCISIAESIMNEQITILPNRCTFPELVGKGYPYLFDNEDEQLNMMREIIKENKRQYDYKTKNQLTLKNHSANINKYFQKLGVIEKSDVFNSIKKEHSKKEIKKYLSKHDEVSLHVFKNFIFSLGYASQSFPMKKIKVVLNELGSDYNINTDKFQKIYYE